MNKGEFEFQYPNGPLISRNLAEKTLKSFMDRIKIEIQDMGTGWIWYKLSPFRDGSFEIGFSLAFNRGRLGEIHVFHNDPKLYGSTWADWSEQKEQLRAKNTGLWLRTKGYAPKKYTWGEVWADYDPKSGCGNGGIRYTPF